VALVAAAGIAVYGNCADGCRSKSGSSGDQARQISRLGYAVHVISFCHVILHLFCIKLSAGTYVIRFNDTYTPPDANGSQLS